MKPCSQFAPIIAERASGPVEPADLARLAAHLEACDACRAESARLDDLFALARVAGPSPLEEREAASLPRRLAAAAGRPPERHLVRLWGLGLAAGIAAVAAVVVPVQLHRSRATLPPAETSSLLATADADTETEADALADAAWDSTADTDVDVSDL